MFNYNGDRTDIKNAVVIANDQKLIDNVSARVQMTDSFDMCDCPTEALGYKLKTFIENIEITIEVYYPKWRWSKAVGYYSASKPTTIHVNGYKSIGVFNLVSMFYHETGHMLDNYYTECQCNHGNNNPKGKENTFQWMLNRFVDEFINKKYVEPAKEIVYYKPWYVKLFNFIFRRG